MSLTRLPKRFPAEKIPKLERYLGTLKLFAATGPIEIEQARTLSKTDLEPTEFALDVDFLAKQQMLQTSQQRKRVVCFLTDRGKRILSYFEMLPSTLDFDGVQDIEEENYEDNEANGEDEEGAGEGYEDGDEADEGLGEDVDDDEREGAARSNRR